MANHLPAPVLVIALPTDLDLSKSQTILLQLGYQPDMLLYADNGRAAQSMMTEHLPNLILYHISTPADICLISQLKQQNLDTPVLAIFHSASTALIYSTLLSGAESYMPHQDSISECCESLKIVLRGGAYIHAELAHYLLHQPATQTCLNLAELQLLQGLSQQQSQTERQNLLQMRDYQIYARIKQIYRKLATTSLNS